MNFASSDNSITHPWPQLWSSMFSQIVWTGTKRGFSGGVLARALLPGCLVLATIVIGSLWESAGLSGLKMVGMRRRKSLEIWRKMKWIPKGKVGFGVPSSLSCWGISWWVQNQMMSIAKLWWRWRVCYPR